MSADVDVSAAVSLCKSHGIPSSTFMLYLLSRTANEIENFRYRIRSQGICLHERIDPAFTVLGDDELFYHCTVEFHADLKEFAQRAKKQIQLSLKNKILQDSKGRDDVLYLSCIPWVKFNGISHAMHYSPCDSVPRIYWGKYEKQGNKLIMPVQIQVHHGLADGLHVARHFQKFQAYLQQPEVLFN